MDLKSFLLTLGIFCGGYASNTLLDEVVGAAEKYFRIQTTDSYKTDSKGYIICSTEKPKITNDNVRPLSLNASGERTPRTIRALDLGPMPATIVMVVTANRFQISKVADVKAVLRNLHI